MSTRVDLSSLIAGAVVCGDRGLGVLGSVIRSTTATGAHGPGLLYNDWDSGDDAKEFRAFIVTPPASGTLFVYEDGSFTLTGAADGSYTLTYRLFVDGVDLGTTNSSITIGNATFTVGSCINNQLSSTSAISQIHNPIATSSTTNNTSSNASLGTGIINLTSAANVSNSTSVALAGVQMLVILAVSNNVNTSFSLSVMLLGMWMDSLRVFTPKARNNSYITSRRGIT